jgi:hypothetical protein
VRSMTIARWQPSRAGILNVYQYEDETLHFAGGRLMLRGVNGSDRSAAMNMLLPSTSLPPKPRPPASSHLGTPRPHRGHPWDTALASQRVRRAPRPRS